MDKEELLVRIKNAAQALVHQVERLGQPAPTRTDFEATLANVRSLYEYISVLNYLQRYGHRLPAEALAPEGKPELSVPSLATSAPAPQAGVSEEPLAKPQSLRLDNKSDPEAETFTPRYSAVKPSANEPASEAVLADRLRLMPVDDLRKAISLADKFQYIYELFGGENNAYHAALDALNALHHKAEAEQYLNDLASIYSWDTESDTVQRFRELVAKRFSG
jgi:hypothetical protein